MRKIFTFIILSFLPFFSIAQIQKGSFLISGALGMDYKKDNSSMYDKTLDWLANSKVGYFIIPNVAIGITGNYEQANYKNSKFSSPSFPSTQIRYFSDNLTKEQTFSGGIFTEYYLPIHKKLYFTANLSLTIGKMESAYTYYQSAKPLEIALEGLDSTYNTMNEYSYGYSLYPNDEFEAKKVIRTFSLFQATLSPALVYFVTDKIGISLRVQGFKFLLTKETTSKETLSILHYFPHSKEKATNFSFSATSFSVGLQLNL